MEVTRSRHVIAVPSVARSASWYHDVLGFEVCELGDPGWRLLRHDACWIMMGECEDAQAPGDLGDHAFFAYLEVDDVDWYHERVTRRGARIRKPLRDEPWGMREFALETIDGHRIMVGEPLEAA